MTVKSSVSFFVASVLLNCGLLVATSSTVSAQQVDDRAVALPGSVNASLTTIGPLEPDNVVGSATFEQGFTAWRRGPLFVVGFMDATFRADSRGYAWNNTLPYVAGAKLVAAGSRGVFQAAVGVAGTARGSEATGLTEAAYVSYWAGWVNANTRLELPGRMWAVSGLTAASEPGNWITAAHVEQGVAAWRRKGVAVVPFVAATATVDTKSQSWNNRGSADGGVKVTTRFRGAAIDVGVAQRTTRAWHTGGTASAPVYFANVWLGWMPRVAY